MLSKRNCWKSHFVLTFFNFLWFVSIFSIFCGPQHREIEITIFSKRVIALTTVGRNHQNTEIFRFWRPFLPQNQVFIKMGKFVFSVVAWCFVLFCDKLSRFCHIFEQIITILKRFDYFVNFSHIVLRRTGSPKLQKTCFCVILRCSYSGRKH